ncbi:uncharacterized protein LOC134215659 [Armigeres subalbatus]|uniref:uncharacterized protein LOC134215659 n=1 Tax=Armigeres subalbatus TaxID=124917 RepID=UPI002ED46E5E
MAAAAGASKTWTMEDTYRLINGFQSQPALWKKDNKEYKNKHFRGFLLDQLATDFNTNTEAIKEKMRSLRTIYGQNLKKYAKSDATPKWEFFNAMSFLKSEMLCEQYGMLSSELPSHVNDDSNNFASEEQYEDVLPQQEMLEPVIYLKKIRTKSPIPSHMDNNSNPPPLQELDPDRNRRFGDYVTLTLDMMNDRLAEEKVKLEIQLLLSRAITETATNALEQLASSSLYKGQYTNSQSSDAVFESKWCSEDHQLIPSHDDSEEPT